MKNVFERFSDLLKLSLCFKITNDNKYSFCQKEKETYKHIFYTCEFARNVCHGYTVVFLLDLRDLSRKEIKFGIDKM